LNAKSTLLKVYEIVRSVIQRCAFVKALWCTEKGGTCSMLGEIKSVYRILVQKPEEKRPLGRPRYIWEDNIEVDLGDVHLRVSIGIDLAEDRNAGRLL
jgi:hypothetical protein